MGRKKKATDNNDADTGSGAAGTSLFVFLFLSEQTLSSFQFVYFVPSDGSVCGKL